jgi:DNA modification methylase
MINFNLHGVDLFGEKINPKVSGVIKDKFIMPPFTILDAKQGDWARKRKWLSIGIDSKLGRDVKIAPDSSKYDYLLDFDTTTSIFDPVLCELLYIWFAPKGGQIIDPFCGGSVRGVVANALGCNYWGGDLRIEQINENITQANEIFDGNHNVEYVCGDSLETLDYAPDADFLFSCPPYGDLEVYSDDPKDISNMEYNTFLAVYKRIILKSVKRMKQNTFACFVVGDFRCSKGFYRNFVSHTIDAFEECGARFYNEAILATSIGSAHMRVTRQFNASRKMAKIHQNVLVFVKGDPKIATQNIVNFS